MPPIGVPSVITKDVPKRQHVSLQGKIQVVDSSYSYILTYDRLKPIETQASTEMKHPWRIFKLILVPFVRTLLLGKNKQRKKIRLLESI